jgi:hypothetical protein
MRERQRRFKVSSHCGSSLSQRLIGGAYTSNEVVLKV